MKRRKVRMDRVSPDRLTMDQLIMGMRAKRNGEKPPMIFLDRRIPANRRTSK